MKLWYPLQFHQVSSKSDETQKRFINCLFFCSEFQSVRRIIELRKSYIVDTVCTFLLCTILCRFFLYLPVTPTKAPKTPLIQAKTSILPPDEIKVYTIATKPPLKVDAIVVQADLAASLHLLPVTPKVLEIKILIATKCQILFK